MAQAAIAPDVPQEFLLAEDAGWLVGAVDEQVVFHLPQVEGLVVEARRVSGGVDRQWADLEYSMVAGVCGSTQDGTQAGAQLQVARWVGEEVVGSGLEGSQQVGLLGAGTEQDHREVWLPVSVGAVCPDGAQQRESDVGGVECWT